MDSDNLLLTVAVIAVVVSIVGVSLTYNSISAFESLITGHATENGTVNITISSTASINITSAAGVSGSKNINFGTGYVATSGIATLATNNTCTNCAGSWSGVNGGFLIENIGNVNVSLNVSSDVTAATFIGGSDGVGPWFQYNVSNSEAGSCNTWYGGYPEATYVNFTTTTTGVCLNFSDGTVGGDVLRLDVLVRVPSDASEGTKNATVVLTYASV